MKRSNINFVHTFHSILITDCDSQRSFKNLKSFKLLMKKSEVRKISSYPASYLKHLPSKSSPNYSNIFRAFKASTNIFLKQNFSQSYQVFRLRHSSYITFTTLWNPSFISNRQANILISKLCHNHNRNPQKHCITSTTCFCRIHPMGFLRGKKSLQQWVLRGDETHTKKKSIKVIQKVSRLWIFTLPLALYVVSRVVCCVSIGIIMKIPSSFNAGKKCNEQSNDSKKWQASDIKPHLIIFFPYDGPLCIVVSFAVIVRAAADDISCLSLNCLVRTPF